MSQYIIHYNCIILGIWDFTKYFNIMKRKILSHCHGNKRSNDFYYHIPQVKKTATYLWTF